MQKIFGPVMQNAFVVDDLEAAMDFWLNKMGVGPFFVFQHVQFKEAYYRGAPMNIDFSGAIAYWGEVQIELIKQYDNEPSIYSDFLGKGLRGMHHMGVLTDDLDAHLARLKPAGIEPIQWGELPTGMRFAYLNTDFHPGGMIELIETHESIMTFFKIIRDAADAWDGKSDSIRRF